MTEFYQLLKTKPLSKEEIDQRYANFKVLCLCDSYRIANARRFHSILDLSIIEWSKIMMRYPDFSISITRPMCQCMNCQLLERTEIYAVWRKVK
jgi:hypothetical protein